MRRFALIAALLASALASGGCGANTLTVPSATDDPRGRPSIFEAYDLLRDAGFNVEIANTVRVGSESGPIPCDCETGVVQQWPAPGTSADQGSTVEIAAVQKSPHLGGSRVGFGEGSTYDREVPLPDLTGVRLGDAIAWLSRHDLGWSAELPRLPSSNRKNLLDAYVVTAQHPGAGHQVGVDYRVEFDLAPTPGLLAEWAGPTVAVPHVLGMDPFNAYDRLRDRGLRVATDGRLSLRRFWVVPVTTQSVQPGRKARRGSTVTLGLDTASFRSFPPGFRIGSVGLPRRMPNLIGQRLSEVVQWAERRDLWWELDAPALPPSALPDLLDAYVVSAQRPRAGTRPTFLTEGAGNANSPIKLRASVR